MVYVLVNAHPLAEMILPLIVGGLFLLAVSVLLLIEYIRRG